MNNAMKDFCIDQMEKIIAAKGEEPHLSDVSKEEIEEALLKISNSTVRSKGTISGAVKSVLYNLDNFRPEVRSEFESRIFEVWREEYKKSRPERTEPAKAEPEPEPAPEPEPDSAREQKVESVAASEAKAESAAEAEAEPGVDSESEPVAELDLKSEPEPEEESASKAAIEPEPEPETQKKPEPVSETEFESKSEPETKPESETQIAEKSEEEEVSTIREDDRGVVLQARRRDWFDLLLDASAALTKPFRRKK